MEATERGVKGVPGLNVRTIEASCCGMAGAFGYGADTVETSLAMAELSLLPAVRKAAADDLIVADGTSCRHQIRDGTGREALHTARVLDLALPVGAVPSDGLRAPHRVGICRTSTSLEKIVDPQQIAARFGICRNVHLRHVAISLAIVRNRSPVGIGGRAQVRTATASSRGRPSGFLRVRVMRPKLLISTSEGREKTAMRTSPARISNQLIGFTSPRRALNIARQYTAPLSADRRSAAAQFRTVQ